jgi:ABC-type xylose transport system permease subunit
MYTKIGTIAGVIIGGASLSGGKGIIMGAVLGGGI